MQRKKKIRGARTFLLFILAAVLAAGAGCAGADIQRNENKGEAAGEQAISVVTTLFPYYDFARAVAGDLAEDGTIRLSLILPPGQESHSFEPTAANLIEMENADVLLYNGGEGEQWVERVLEATDAKDRLDLEGMEVVSLREEETSENMKGHSHTHDKTGHEGPENDGEDSFTGHAGVGHDVEYDEHIWTSPVNAIDLVKAVCGILAQAAPDYRQVFEDNAQAYIAQLEEIDGEFREVTANGRTDLVIFADRFPFLYFVREYGLRYDAAFSGCGSDTEPSAATIAGLIELVEKEQLPVIFHVEQSSQKTAKIIQESTGVEILELHSCHNLTKQEMDDGITYVQLMRGNIENLKKALQ